VRCGSGDGGRRRAAELRAGLLAAGVRVRDVGSAAGLAGCLRIAVGGGAALRAVDRALGEIGGVR
jgi:histidinol-phosphate/aromatic aminotransferase/cobyric acid decarboxylase-like protein